MLVGCHKLLVAPLTKGSHSNHLPCMAIDDITKLTVTPLTKGGKTGVSQERHPGWLYMAVPAHT